MELLSSNLFWILTESAILVIIIILMIFFSKRNRNVLEKIQEDINRQRQSELDRRLSNPLSGSNRIPGQPMVSILVHTQGGDQNHQFPVGKIIRIGRDRSNDVHIRNSFVARQQLEVYWPDPMTAAVRNLGMVNPVFMDRHGSRFQLKDQPEKLKNDDTILIGDVTLVFHI